jgi:predicted peptidase
MYISNLMTSGFQGRLSLVFVLTIFFAAVARAETAEIETTLAEINDRFQNMEVKLVEWPDDLQPQLGELKKTAFMAYPVKQVEGKLPLLIALHGGGGKANTVEQQLARSATVKGLALAEAAEKNLILLEPNSAGDFDPKTLNTMLDYILKTYPEIDENRVYVMGHSMGGAGTWNWINASPERFAAAAPCGFSATETGDASRLVELPIWGMVGGKDGVNTARIKSMVERLRAAGNSNVKHTEFPGATHSKGNAGVFRSVDLVDWMLTFSRKR